MAYKERLAGYNLTQDPKGIQGQRVFVTDATGTVLSLPLVLSDLMIDENDSPIPNCFARRIRTAYEGNIAVVTVSYNTRDSYAEYSGSTVSNNPTSRRYEVMADLIHIDNPETLWTWGAGGDAITKPIGKPIVTSSFSIPVSGLTDTQKTAFLTLVKAQAGTINDAAFEDWAAGQVRFDGIRGGDTFDEDGDQSWAFELEFTARLINDDDASTPSTDHWRYEWRSASGGGWDQPKIGSKFLYKKSTFGDPDLGTGLFNY